MESKVNIGRERLNEYIKSKVKAVLETFATLGEMIGGTSDVSQISDAEKVAQEIKENNPSSEEIIHNLEKSMEIPEKGNIKEREENVRTPKNYKTMPNSKKRGMDPISKNQSLENDVKSERDESERNNSEEQR